MEVGSEGEKMSLVNALLRLNIGAMMVVCTACRVVMAEEPPTLAAPLVPALIEEPAPAAGVPDLAPLAATPDVAASDMKTPSEPLVEVPAATVDDLAPVETPTEETLGEETPGVETPGVEMPGEPLVMAPVGTTAKATGPTKRVGFEGIKGTETVITSARIEFDYKEMVAVFDEDVRVANPQFLMLADRVLVFLDGTNDVKQILALGRVSMTNDIRSASCDKAVYTRATDQIVLTGNAALRRGGDSVKGDRIAIWLNDERMEVSPGTFVIAPGTIRDQEKTTNDKKRPDPATPPAKPHGEPHP